MARLLTLPIELLLSVIERVRFQDIECLTTCCKGLYTIGQTHLQEHLAMKRAYTSIVCGPSNNPMWPNPFKLLRDILSDEERAHYTTSCIIKDCNAEIDPDDESDQYPSDNEDTEEVAHPDLSGMKDEISEKVQHCKYITGYVKEYTDMDFNFVEDEWIYDFLSGRRPDSTLALLIVSFANLQSLAISDNCWDAHHLFNMISRLCWESHQCPHKFQSLRKLTDVSLNGEIDSPDDFGLLVLFSLVPSVLSLTGRFLNGARAFQDRIWEMCESKEEANPEAEPIKSSLMRS